MLTPKIAIGRGEMGDGGGMFGSVFSTEGLRRGEIKCSDVVWGGREDFFLRNRVLGIVVFETLARYPDSATKCKNVVRMELSVHVPLSTRKNVIMTAVV